MSFRDDPASVGGSDPATAPPATEPTGASAEQSIQSEQAVQPDQQAPPANMLPGRERRRFGAERVLIRLVATGGIIAIGVVIAAILASSKVQGWIIGLVVAGVSVILSAVLWSSRQL